MKDFDKFREEFMPLVRNLELKIVLEIISEFMHEKKVGKHFFFLAIDELRKLEEFDIERVIFDLKNVSSPYFELIPIFTALDPSALGSEKDLTKTFSDRLIFSSILPRMEIEKMKELANRYLWKEGEKQVSEEIKKFREFAFKVLKMTGGHFRTIEFVDKKLREQIENKTLQRDQLYTSFTHIISYGFLYNEKEEDFWKWACIPLLQLNTSLEETFCSKKSLKVRNLIVEGILINDKLEITNFFDDQILSNCHTTISNLYNFAKQYIKQQKDANETHLQHVCKLLEEMTFNTLTYNDYQAWELFNAFFIISQLQLRAYLIDCQFIKKKMDSEKSSPINLSSLNEKLTKRIEIQLKINQLLIEEKKLLKKNECKLFMIFKRDLYDKIKNFEGKEWKKFVGMFTDQSFIDNTQFEKFFGFWKSSDESDKEWKKQLFTNSILRSYSAHLSTQSSIELEKNSKLKEKTLDLNKKIVPNTLKLLSQTFAVSLDQLFHSSLKVGADFKERNVESILIKLVEIDVEEKIIPIKFEVSRDSEEGRSLADRFKKEDFLFHTLYLPSLKNEAGKDAILALKTVEGKDIFFVFQYRSRENESQIYNTGPKKVRQDIDKFDLKSIQNSINERMKGIKKWKTIIFNKETTIFCYVTSHKPPLLKKDQFLNYKDKLLAVTTIKPIGSFFGKTCFPFPLYDDKFNNEIYSEN